MEIYGARTTEFQLDRAGGRAAAVSGPCIPPPPPPPNVSFNERPRPARMVGRCTTVLPTSPNHRDTAAAAPAFRHHPPRPTRPPAVTTTELTSSSACSLIKPSCTPPLAHPSPSSAKFGFYMLFILVHSVERSFQDRKFFFFYVDLRTLSVGRARVFLNFS